MNAIAQRNVPQQLSVGTHLAVAIAALAVIAGGVVFAGQASEQAVHNAQAAISPAIRYVVLPTVEVIATRSGAEIADAAGCPAPHAKI